MPLELLRFLVNTRVRLQSDAAARSPTLNPESRALSHSKDRERSIVKHMVFHYIPVPTTLFPELYLRENLIGKKRKKIVHAKTSDNVLRMCLTRTS